MVRDVHYNYKTILVFSYCGIRSPMRRPVTGSRVGKRRRSIRPVLMAAFFELCGDAICTMHFLFRARRRRRMMMKTHKASVRFESAVVGWLVALPSPTPAAAAATTAARAPSSWPRSPTSQIPGPGTGPHSGSRTSVAVAVSRRGPEAPWPRSPTPHPRLPVSGPRVPVPRLPWPRSADGDKFPAVVRRAVAPSLPS